MSKLGSLPPQPLNASPLEKSVPPSPRSKMDDKNASNADVQVQAPNPGRARRGPPPALSKHQRSKTLDLQAQSPRLSEKRSTLATDVLRRSTMPDDTDDIQLAITSASLAMEKVLTALKSNGSAQELQVLCDEFVAAQAPLKRNLAEGDALVDDAHNGRLQLRLQTMPLQKLQAVGKASATLAGNHVVIERLYLAATKELARREAVLMEASRAMEGVLRHLLSGNLTGVRHCCHKFNQAIVAANVTISDGGVHLRRSLVALSLQDLQAVGPAAMDFLERAKENPVVLYLKEAANGVLLERMDATPKKVDEAMEKVLDAFASGDAQKIATGIKAFKETAAREVPSVQDDVFVVDAHMERLQWRLATMSTDKLEAIREAMVSYAGHVNDPVVARIEFALLAEGVRRQMHDLRTKGYAGVAAELSGEQLQVLIDMASYLISAAPQRSPNADATQRIPGTAFTRSSLQETIDQLSKQLATRTVSDVPNRTSNSSSSSSSSIPSQISLPMDKITDRTGPLQSADKELASVLKDLIEDASAAEVEASCKRFSDALKLEHRHSSGSQSVRDGDDSFRMQLQLGLMSPRELEAIVKTTGTLRAKPGSVVALILKAARIELLGLRQPWAMGSREGISPPAEYRAEQNLAMVFAALVSGNGRLAKEMNVDFRKEMTKPLREKDLPAPFTAEIYGERLRLRVKEMAIEKLEAYSILLEEFPDKGNPLVNRIGVVVKAEIESRRSAQIEEQQRFSSAKVHMSGVLAALRSDNQFKAAESVEDFVKAMQPLHRSMDLSDGAAFDLYKDRLSKPLSKVSESNLKALARGATQYLLKLNDAVVEGIRVAVNAELARRSLPTASTGAPKERPSS